MPTITSYTTNCDLTAVRQPSPHSEASSSVNNLYGQYT
jgi:hypothetical protein